MDRIRREERSKRGAGTGDAAVFESALLEECGKVKEGELMKLKWRIKREYASRKNTFLFILQYLIFVKRVERCMR